jgi:hypothetical protein
MPEELGMDQNAGAIAGGFLPQAPGIIAPQADYSNDKRLMELFRQAKKECFDSRWVFERLWWRNMLYTLGRQWIYFDKRRGQWLDKRMAKWMPRPTTNKISEAVEAIMATFASINLSTIARPIGGSLANIATAEIADQIQPFLHQDHQMDRTMRDADFWLVVTGNAFLHPHWDHSETYGTILIPHERCQRCGKVSTPEELQGPMAMCPACGAMDFDKAPTDEAGAPIGTKVPVGKGRTEALSPWELAIPPAYTNFEETTKVIRQSWRPREYIEERYPDIAKGMTWEKTPNERSMQLLRALATQSDLSAMPLSFTWGAGQESESEGKAEYELWLKPNRDFEDGLFLKVIGDGDSAVIVHEGNQSSPGPLPYQTKDGKPIFPFIHMGYQPVGGRLWARGPLDLVVQKQDQINQLDSLIQLIVQRMANPVWLEPKGAEVKSFTGEPGLIVKYSPLASGGAKPERIEGSNVQASLFQLRQQYLDDFEQLAGTFDVLKGAKPAGVEAFSALQLLVERGQARLATVFAERGEAYRQWFSIALELERMHGPTERVYSILSPNRGWTYVHFENAQLQGAVDIVVEDGSQAPKTNLGRRAAIEHANQLRMIDPMDAEQRYTALTDLGLHDYVKTLDTHVKKALSEQDAFERWAQSPEFQALLPQLEQTMLQFQQESAIYQQQSQQAAQIESATGVPAAMAPPPTLQPMTPFQLKPYHKPDVHYAEHVKWANSDTATELFQQYPILEQFFLQHLTETQMAMQAEMAAMAAAQAPQQGGAMERSNGESGNPRDVPRGNKDTGSQGRGPE